MKRLFVLSIFPFYVCFPAGSYGSVAHGVEEQGFEDHRFEGNSFEGRGFEGIETLVVTGKAQATLTDAQRLDKKELMPGPGVDAAEFLQGAAGVQADSRSNYAQDTRVTMRGFGARSAFGVRGVDLQIDGIPLTMPDGQGQFSGIMLDSVTQVNVLSGPVAALYGNAAGGVISLKTSAPDSSRITLGGAVDESGLEREQLLGEWQQDNFALRAQASHLNAEGDRPHAAAERDQIGVQAYYKFSNGVQAQWRFDNEDAPLLQDPLGLTLQQWQEDPRQPNSSAEFFNTRKSIEHQQNALSFRDEEGEQRWQTALWAGDRHIQQHLALKGDALSNSGGVVDLKREFSGANGNYTWEFSLGERPASFTLGAEISSMDDRRHGYVNESGNAGRLRRDELGKVDGRDAYALLQWQATNSWHLLAGLRHSQLRFNVRDYFIIPGSNADDSGGRRFDDLIKTFATRYQINEAWAVRASVGNGFETPTLTETAYSAGDLGFNRGLDAAQNDQQELGIDYQRKRLSVSLTGFIIETENEIVVDQSQGGRTSYLNAAATEREGLEFSGRYELSSYFDARVYASFLDAIYSSGQWKNMRLPGVAKQNAYVQFNWHPFENNLLRAGISWVNRSDIATNDNNQIKAPGYDTVDFALSGKLSISNGLSSDTSGGWQGDWWVKISNIEDKKYVGSVIVNQTNNRSFEPAPGRNLSAGLTLGYGF